MFGNQNCRESNAEHVIALDGRHAVNDRGLMTAGRGLDLRLVQPPAGGSAFLGVFSLAMGKF